MQWISPWKHVDALCATTCPNVCILCDWLAGRSLSLLDPTYASKYIPIIASVSEHQPPSWPSYFTDLQARPALPPGFAFLPLAVLPW